MNIGISRLVFKFPDEIPKKLSKVKHVYVGTKAALKTIERNKIYNGGVK